MNELYSIDNLHIYFESDCRAIKTILPINLLKNNSKSIKILKTNKRNKNLGFNAVMNVSCPLGNFFKILTKNEKVVGKYKISKIEIARDTIYETEHECEIAFEQFNKLHYLKHYCGHVIFNQLFVSEEEEKKNPKLTKLTRERFSEMTNYLGVEGNFEVATYPRYSKIAEVPCLHTEFKIAHAHQIKKKIGVSTFLDLEKLSPEKTFNDLYVKYVATGEIDKTKLGRWLCGLGKRRKNRKNDEMKIELAATTFLKIFKIHSVAGFRNFINLERKRIEKSKTDRTVLKYPAWDEKISNLNLDFVLKR